MEARRPRKKTQAKVASEQEEQRRPNEQCFYPTPVSERLQLVRCILTRRGTGLRLRMRNRWSTGIMNQGIKRSILRWIHIVISIPIIGYTYSPFEELPNYAPVVRFVAVPAIVLTGLWMWKGHVLRRLISKRPAGV
jgi:hypothetical protein